MTEDKVDIILATHNHFELTARAIKAIYDYTNIPFRLIIIDDSTDITPTVIHAFQEEHDNINYLRPEEKLYHANQVINIGLKNTKTPLVVYMGNSTFVEPEWLEPAYGFMKAHPDVGILGFKILFESGVIEHAGIYFTPDMHHHMNFGVGAPAWTNNYIREVPAVGFSLVVLRREAIPKEGLDTETYFGFRGFDDVDNCFTLRQNGWKIVYCGLGCAKHIAVASKAESPEFMAEYEINRLRFCQKWSKILKEEAERAQNE